MAWSYVGLLAATVNEGFVRVSPLQTLAARTAAPLPLLVMACVVVASGVVIFAMQRRVLARYEGRAEPSAAADPDRQSISGYPKLPGGGPAN